MSFPPKPLNSDDKASASRARPKKKSASRKPDAKLQIYMDSTQKKPRADISSRDRFSVLLVVDGRLLDAINAAASEEGEARNVWLVNAAKAYLSSKDERLHRLYGVESSGIR